MSRMTSDVLLDLGFKTFDYRQKTYHCNGVRQVNTKIVLLTNLHPIVLLPSDYDEISNIRSSNGLPPERKVNKVNLSGGYYPPETDYTDRDDPESSRVVKKKPIKTGEFSESEETFIRKNYETWGFSRMASVLNRSTDSVIEFVENRIIKKIDDKGNKFGAWEKKEDEYLIKWFRIDLQMALKLINRNEASIKARAFFLKL
mgnify:CR=1 FL=1